MKELVKKYLPEDFVNLYHSVESFCAAFWYGFPGKKLTVIGITGTKGKTTTANFIWTVLTAGGIKTGIISTANIRVGNEEWLNKYRMTFPPAWETQRLLRQILDAGCTHVILEATSAALSQNRHLGINFSVGIFTNLAKEHLELHHNSFEEYRSEKQKLFEALSYVPHSISIVNADSEQAPFFTKYTANQKITFGIQNGDVRAKDIVENKDGVSFIVNNNPYKINILGAFNVYNALPAITLGTAFKIPTEKIQQGLEKLSGIPGRMEQIQGGQEFTVIVDYAHEGLSVGTVLDSAKRMLKENGRILVVTGATGGGRDKAKREDIGTICVTVANIVYVTNEDPYEDDPAEIIADITRAVKRTGKIENENLFVISDRRIAIEKALANAQKNDIVLIIGKGAEQSMQVKGGAIAWDDRAIAREALLQLRMT